MFPTPTSQSQVLFCENNFKANYNSIYKRLYVYILRNSLSIKTLAICLLTCKALDKAAFMNRPGVKRLRKYISY